MPQAQIDEMVKGVTQNNAQIAFEALLENLRKEAKIVRRRRTKPVSLTKGKLLQYRKAASAAFSISDHRLLSGFLACATLQWLSNTRRNTAWLNQHFVPLHHAGAGRRALDQRTGGGGKPQ